jgi:glycogen debranching enzyme
LVDFSEGVLSRLFKFLGTVLKCLKALAHGDKVPGVERVIRGQFRDWGRDRLIAALAVLSAKRLTKASDFFRFKTCLDG